MCEPALYVCGRPRARVCVCVCVFFRWPFIYDPVYGLPVINDVWTYGQVLRGIREGRVTQLLWYV